MWFRYRVLQINFERGGTLYHFYLKKSKEKRKSEVHGKSKILTEVSSTKIDGNFFSVATTTPLAAA